MGLRMTPVAPRAGDNVHFSITGSYSGTGACCATVLDLGDGTAAPVSDTMAPDPCPATRPITFNSQVDHVYSHAGTFSVDLEPAVLSCSLPPVAAGGQLRVTIVVGPDA